MNDPRANGFNYGAGWGSKEPLPQVYHRAMEWAKSLGQVAMVASQQEWEVSQACRAVRLAETPAEKEAAVNALRDLVLIGVDHG